MDVQQSFNRVVSSQRDREAAEQNAEANRILLVGQAKAESESQILRAKGIAESRQVIAQSLRESVSQGSGAQLSEQDIMSFLIEAARLDTIHSAAATGKLVIMDIRNNNGNIPNFDVQ